MLIRKAKRLRNLSELQNRFSEGRFGWLSGNSSGSTLFSISLNGSNKSLGGCPLVERQVTAILPPISLIKRHKLPQKPHIVFGKQPQVFDLVLDHCNALEAHPEGEAGVLLGVDATTFQHVRVYHAATTDF